MIGFLQITVYTRIALCLLIFTSIAHSKLTISNSDELITALSNPNPKIKAIILKDGNYKFDRPIFIKSISNKKSSFLTIKASNPGKVVFTGNGALKFHKCNNLEISGIVFKLSRGLEFDSCEGIKVKNCFFNLKVIDDKVHWLSFKNNSRDLLVEHCDFGPRKVVGKSHGSYIRVGGSNIRDIRIANNYFFKKHHQGWNGGETIYLHGTGIWALHAVIEDNLFVECNGEHELIGIKSHRNIIRNNSFINCLGAVSVRNGSYNLIYNNTFISDSKRRDTGGARLFGEYNVFANNYLYQIKTPLEAMWAENDPPYFENGFHSSKTIFNYGLSKNNLILFNTFEKCENIVTIFKKSHEYDPKELFNPMYGTYRKKLWEKTLHKTLVGNTYHPTLAPEKWTFLGNNFKQPERITDSKFVNGASFPIKEKEFKWVSNYLNGQALSYDHQRHQFSSQNDAEKMLATISKTDLEFYTQHQDLLKLIKREQAGSQLPTNPLKPSEVGITYRTKH